MVYKWALQIPNLSPELTRRAYLYLPACYDEQPDARFPVMYMFDGHNVFFDEDATYGQSWGMADYMDKTDTPLIIAAVECNPVGNNRLVEYCPFTCEDPNLGRIRGRGRATMEWFIRDFKPMIDANLRTLPDRANTLIAGSSMGGLMSLYAATAFNDVFGRAACLSPSLWLAPAKARRFIRQAEISPDTLIYMDYGGEEMANHASNLSALTTCSSALLQKGVSGDPTCVNAYEALKMATVGGAKAQGREAEIGQIGEGFDADLILIDTDSPVLRPVYDPVSTTAYSATGRDVCLTMVQGRILYENGCFTTIDVEQAIREVEEYAVPIVRG